MSPDPYCAFCQMSGFAGPHDHFVRETRDPNSAVTCPLLLATECSFCHKKGHTAKYCAERQKSMLRSRTVCVKEKNVSSEEGQWMSQPRRRAAKPMLSQNSVDIKVTAGGFAQLDLENSSDSEQDNGAGVISQSVSTGLSWADVTKQNVAKQTVIKQEPVVKKQTVDKRPSGMSWADWDDDDEDEDEDE